jgi:dCMP deaminase
MPLWELKMIKEKYLGAYMKSARVFGNLSAARRKKVGAIVVKDDRIISIGYNGMPSGWDNNCEDEIVLQDVAFKEQGGPGLEYSYVGLKTKPEVLHAESNAIAKLAKSTESGNGASLFVTCAPCLECAKMIYQSGIKEVFYAEDYRANDGLNFLNKCGIFIRKVNEND